MRLEVGDQYGVESTSQQFQHKKYEYRYPTLTLASKRQFKEPRDSPGPVHCGLEGELIRNNHASHVKSPSYQRDIALVHIDELSINSIKPDWFCLVSVARIP